MAKAKPVVRQRNGGWFEWSLVTSFGEKISGYGGVERHRTTALHMAQRASVEYNSKIRGEKRPYRLKNTRSGGKSRALKLVGGAVL